MARANIKIDREAFERHSERKDYYNLSWKKYLDAGCPEIPDEEI